MWILPTKKPNVEAGDLYDGRVCAAVQAAVAASRFTADVAVARLGSKCGVKVSRVRLRRKKGYCGAHPGPCLVGGRRHTVASYLEGNDWIGFNHLVNDALDRLGAEWDFFSFNRESLTPRYFARRGRRRRVAYPYEYHPSGRFAHWTQGGDDCFEDYCGKPPPEVAGLRDGTPGYACTTLEQEEVFRADEEAAV